MEKVLCVDDDSSLLCLYQEELSEEGYKVLLAKDGKEALSRFMKVSVPQPARAVGGFQKEREPERRLVKGLS